MKRGDELPQTKLTPTEAGAHRLAMMEHRAAKCRRCCGRLDLNSGGYRCGYGEDADERMSDIKTCRKWVLDEDQSRWLAYREV